MRPRGRRHGFLHGETDILRLRIGRVRHELKRERLTNKKLTRTVKPDFAKRTSTLVFTLEKHQISSERELFIDGAMTTAPRFGNSKKRRIGSSAITGHRFTCRGADTCDSHFLAVDRRIPE